MSTRKDFKEAFKYYKSRHPDPDISGVIDFDKISEETCIPYELGQLDVNPYPQLLKPSTEWNCYEIKSNPGLLFIRNPFTPLGQRYLIVRSIRDYTKAPNAVNLTPKKFENDVIDDWWRGFLSASDQKFKETLKVSMRWATLGYHHDWDTKVYSESMKNEFPRDLAEVTKYFATVLGYEKYSAEAAIVNFYPIGTTLSGHTDHSEADLDAPLFSFSFGQKAIFLIGGPMKEEPATPLFLRSGDIVVMSKKSRLCYHAVPRVMKDSSEPWQHFQNDELKGCDPPESKKLKGNVSHIQNDLLDDCRDISFWKPFYNYLQTTRININIRQVLKEGQTSLSQ